MVQPLTFTCPRRLESVYRTDLDQDTYIPRNHCSYCGSLNPDSFMDRLEVGDVKLTPTDKNYKVYVDNNEGARFHQGSNITKFYFQHLSEDQRRKFVDLYNARRIKFVGSTFYVLPFFMKPLSI